MRPIIDIVTRPYCEACEKAKKQVYASSPESHGVTVNIQDLGEESGRTAVPWMMIGDTIVETYDAAKVSDALTALYESLDAGTKQEEPPVPVIEDADESSLPNPPIVQPDSGSIVSGVHSRGTVLVFSLIAGFVLGMVVSDD